MKTLTILVTSLALLISGCEMSSAPESPKVLGTLTPEIDGNEIVFKGIYKLEDAENKVDDLRINYTAWDGCGTSHWIYNRSLGIWWPFTSRQGDICTLALVPTSLRFENRGFPLSEYVTPQGDLRLRYGTLARTSDAHLSDYTLDVLSY